MDQLLRAYAKMRREQAQPPPALHPATRKLLQDEVRRTFGTPQSQPKPIGLGAWLAARWRLVAVGGAAVALFVVITVLNAPSWNQSFATRHSVGSAPLTQSGPPAANRSDSVPAPAPAATPAPASPPPSAQSTIASAKLPTTEADKSASPLVVSGPLPANGPELAATPAQAQTLAPASPIPSAQPTLPVPAPPASAAASINPPLVPVPLMDRNFEAAKTPAAGEIQENTAAAAPVIALSSDASGTLGVAAQNFVQVNTRNRSRALQPPLSNILSAFQMERVGANVRITDADGSVYKGEVLGRPAPGGGAGFGGARGTTAKAFKDAKGNANWAFKVSGTNKNLQQNVVFIGNVLDMPQAMPAEAARPANAAPAGLAQNRNAPQTSNAQDSFYARRLSSAQNSRPQQAQNPLITGKVQVGGGKEFEIEAKPPAP